MKNYIKRFFENAFDFKGNASRSEFLAVLLITFVIGAVSSFDSIVPGLEYIIAIIALTWLVPSISLTVRRFNDAGIAGGLAILLLILPIMANWFPASSTLKFALEAICLILVVGIGVMAPKKAIS
ncbi:DUF805 domain-containing protein [uncultured Secundilactobacillus sp.]|uniref:DUF805 domain-containing protein n=1 Tax=uncultured Secundilactobacillus sp. TaxID=2813935 RepID=UPI00258804D9|nr:DUF805 domain-containing protein [uncultured Secundilactobacillus sp.]